MHFICVNLRDLTLYATYMYNPVSQRRW